MSVKEIDNQNATKSNATRGKASKINTNKYIEHDQSKPITTRMREKWTDKYNNLHIQVVAIGFSRRREQQPSDSRRPRQGRRQSVVIQSVLCEVRVNKTVGV